MAALSGTAGSVVYMTGGTVNVGEIAEWALDISHSPVDATAFGNDRAKYVPSIRNATGTFSGNFDHSDSAQASLISAMLGGSAVAFRLYVSPTKYFNVGTAYLTGMGPSISQTGKADNSYSFQNSAAVSFV
jgi:hypothetical protein